MFGGKSSNRKSNTRQQRASSENVDIDDIETLLHDSLTNEEADIDENDFNDPELLAQLQALASSSAPSQKNTKSTQPAQTKKPATASKPGQTADMDIDWESYTALTQTGDDVQVELNESDFSDPHLLKELSAISSTVPMDTDTPKPSESAKPTNPDDSTLQLMNMGFTQNQATKALDMFDYDMERATNFLLDSPSPGGDGNQDQQHASMETTPVHDDNSMDYTSQDQSPDKQMDRTPAPPSSSMPENLDDKDQEDPIDLKEKSQLYQQRALIAKKRGDKKQAVALLRESKLLLQQYHQLAEQNDNHSTNSDRPPFESSSLETKTSPPSVTPVSTPAATNDTPPLLVEETATHTTAPAISSPSSTEATAPVSITPAAASSSPPSATVVQAQQELLQRVIQLQREYKEAAHHYKDIGNLIVTKEMIKTSKSLLKTGIQLKQQQLTEQEVEQTGKRLPDHPDLSLGNGKLRHVQPVTEFNQPTTEQIETQLAYQIDICHNLEIQQQQQQQQHLLPLKQAFAADLVTLRAASTSSELPSLHYENVEYVYKNILDHLASNQMELKIMQGTGIQSLDIGTAVEPFVTWDFGGWPPENTAQAQLNKGETPIMKGTEPVFDFTLLIPITRTNRVFMRHLQRKKMLLEVFHNKYSYGFLRRPVSIGKVAIPLDTLLTKTSISGWFDLVDNSRKKTGGKLKIQLGLSEPLTGQDITRRNERWLVLDGLGQQTSQLMYTAGLTQAPYTSSSPAAAAAAAASVSPNNDSPSTPSVDVPTPSSQPPAQPRAAEALPKESNTTAKSSDTPPTGNTELESAEEEIDSVDVLVSNMVLEHEINVASAALSNSNSNNGRTKEEWMDRKQALDIKMNMLVIQVQTGMLDMQQYLESVEKRMQRDRQLALVFKKHQRLDLAKLALARKKIMQDELDEAKAAMAAQQDE
ncbi:hypothetical protein BCR42DRAFT_457377 [Absidia repens]|uniref:UBA domain-containing protein n=1 Tax=Absidia repens TaxID=90262 RepID=A0A1X2HR38_9FUNG|nr:hypothetical protein BCR42DRAFT_457377 [Absidia repens]